MNDSLKQAIKGVRVLWPTLSPMEKLNWCEHLAEPLGVDDWWDVVPFFVSSDEEELA